MFKGRNSGEGSGHRSLLLDAAFRYDPERDDLEVGIITPPSPISPVAPNSLKSLSVQQDTAGQSLEDDDSGIGQKSLQDVPTPPPQPTPQHQVNPVKDLVSRLRKQASSKDQKAKDSSAVAAQAKDKDAKDRKGTDNNSTLSPATKDDINTTNNAKINVRDTSKDRSRTPSPITDLPRDKESTPHDGSWFGGIKGKIAKKLEEKRARSLSVPVATVPKSVLEDREDDDDIVERAEEASPESMLLEQELADSGQQKDGVQSVELTTEDDSWEKLDALPSDEFSQQNIFYQDFARVKERWLALDSSYVARAFPDIVEELQSLSLRMMGVLGIALISLLCIPLPSFIQGFIVASIIGWLVNLVSGFLWPQSSVPNRRTVPDATKAPSGMLLMPRTQEISFLEGWLNALPAGETYDVRTHLGSHCHSVHMRLTGTTLRIRPLKEKLPRRAMWNEKHRDINSVVLLGKQWFVELDGASVRLLPEGLSSTRLWNKKYPIAVSVPERNGEDAKEVFLFARTCRDKEHWFRLLKNASISNNNQHQNSITKQLTTPNDHNAAANVPGGDEKPEEEEVTARSPVDFFVYMNNLSLNQKVDAFRPVNSEDKKSASNSSSCPPMNLDYHDADTQWVNIVMGRILYDFFTQPRWAAAVRAKFQKKLSKIKVPFFMQELTITDIDLGESIPLIRRTSAAVHCPNTGVWLDLELAYNGCFQVTVNTKLNLMKLKKQGLQDKPPVVVAAAEQEMQEMTTSMELKYEDEIPSEDDDDDVSNGTHTNEGELEEAQGATSKKILDMVDRISQWSLFQQATETAFIKKKMEEFSNTDLKLTIQLSSLVGRLALNIPPPPTDRLWYGFRSVPRLDFKATPQMGEREISFKEKLAAIIEKALFQEFQRVLVMPNMDDLQLELMESDV